MGTFTFPLYLITGLSGAGKSEAIQAFEDMGFYCLDNLPVELVQDVINHYRNNRSHLEGIALVTDLREGDFVEEFPSLMETLRSGDSELRVLFLEASTNVLLNRYKESRRPHPLGRDRSLEKAIATERERLKPVREKANLVIDTSEFNPRQFRGMLTDLHSPGSLDKFTVSFISFGYKNGVPAHVDVLFDARFLPNPYYEENLKSLSGTNDAVHDYFKSVEQVETYLDHLKSLLDLMIEEYSQEGKKLLSVGVGCTGGRHRSVYIVQKLVEYLNESPSRRSVVTHRDLES